MDTEIRTRIVGPGKTIVIETVVTADGKRRILRDQIGTIETTADGLWVLTVSGHNRTAHETHADALAVATKILKD